MEGTPRLALVGDADVLIDIADADEAVLALIVQHLARVIVPTPVIAEVDALDELKCAALGLEVLEPTLEQLQEAAVPHPALSFADRVCLIVARDAGAACWTNDGPLGDDGEAGGPPRMRGCGDAGMRGVLRPVVGEYSYPELPEVTFALAETVIRDQAGREVERRGTPPT